MIRTALRTLALFLVTGFLASAAQAKEGSETAAALRFMLFGGNTPIIGSSGSESAGIVGGSAQWSLPVGKGRHWTIAPGASYGLGHFSDTQTSGGVTTKGSDDIHTWAGFLDWLYYSGCCDDDDWYCGPGIFYSSTSITDKFTGASDQKFTGIHSYGIQLTEGGGVPLTSKATLFGGATQRIGFTKFKDTPSPSVEEKLSSITHSLQFQGGLKLKF